MSMTKPPEEHRLVTHPSSQFHTTEADGVMGAWQFTYKHDKRPTVTLRCIADNGGGWEHVSVSLNRPRVPNWDEMCFVKEVFWEPEDCVVQYHPPASQYVNCHPHVLHLWRPIADDWTIEGPDGRSAEGAPWPLPQPPKWMV